MQRCRFISKREPERPVHIQEGSGFEAAGRTLMKRCSVKLLKDFNKRSCGISLFHGIPGLFVSDLSGPGSLPHIYWSRLLVPASHIRTGLTRPFFSRIKYSCDYLSMILQKRRRDLMSTGCLLNCQSHNEISRVFCDEILCAFPIYDCRKFVSFLWSSLYLIFMRLLWIGIFITSKIFKKVVL